MKSYSSNIPRLYLIKISKWFALTVPILMLYYHDCGLSNSESFTLKAVYSVIIILFEIPSGYLADAFGRKTTLVIGAMLGVVGMVIYATFGGFWAFLFAELALGLSQSLVSGADSAMMYDSLKMDNNEKRYTMLEGRNTAIGNVAESVAAITGGLLAEISFSLPFIAQSVIAFIAVPAAFTLIEPPSLRVGKASLKQTMAVVKNCALKDLLLRYHLVFSSVIGACTLTMAWIYHPYLKEVLSISVYKIGIVAAILNLIAAVFSASAHRIVHYVKIRAVLWTFALAIPSCYLLIAWFNNYWVLAILALFYVLRGVATPVLKDLVNSNTPSEVRATVLSLRNFIIRVIFVIVAPILGIVSDKYSFRTTFTLLGIVFLVAALFAINSRSTEKK